MDNYHTYLITCAVRLPGKITSTNATITFDDQHVAIWELNLNSLYDETQTITLEITSRRYIWKLIIPLIIIVLAIISWVIIRLLRQVKERNKDPFWRLIS